MDCAISVLLVDDHAFLRKCLQRSVEDDPELTVIGEASNGAEAVELARQLAPRVVVMDLAMPVMDGIEGGWTYPAAGAGNIDFDPQYECGGNMRAERVRGRTLPAFESMPRGPPQADSECPRPALPPPCPIVFGRRAPLKTQPG